MTIIIKNTKYEKSFDKIFDFQEKLDRINSMTYEKAQEVISLLFDEKEKAVALVGNTDVALTL